MKPQVVFCEWWKEEIDKSKTCLLLWGFHPRSEIFTRVQIRIVSRPWEEKGANTLRLRTEDEMKRMSRSKDRQHYEYIKRRRNCTEEDDQYSRNELAARCSGADVRLLALAQFGLGCACRVRRAPKEEWSAPEEG